MSQDHLVSLESRPPDKYGKGAVVIADLLHSSLRLRPDRILIGEVRGGEAFDLMQAMNTGHSGSMCTVHANSPIDTLTRVESLCLMSSVELPMVAVRAQVAAALNIIICTARYPDGSRRLSHISEVLPLNEKGDYRIQDLFVFHATGKDEEGRIQGYHAPTGILPTFLEKLKTYDFPEMDETFFDPATYGHPPPAADTYSEFKIKWIDRLENGEEKWKAKPLVSEKKALLDKALEATLEERDLNPPPMFDDQKFTSEIEPADEEDGDPEPEEVPTMANRAPDKTDTKVTSPGDKEEGTAKTRPGSLARQLLSRTSAGSGKKRPRLGVRTPDKKSGKDDT
jgi:hypothetical protein